MGDPAATQSLEGRHVLVVGASSGIGQAFAVDAARAGARVVMSARRIDKLEETLAAAGSGHAVACDVRDAGAVSRLVAEATAASGPIDLVFYAAGFAPLQTLASTDAEGWNDVFGTNVVGVNLVISAAIGHIVPGGIVAVLSSETAQDSRFGLGAYAASKAALESLLRGWRTEHPALRFSCVQVGATQPTEFGNAFGADVLVPALEHWTLHGLMQDDVMATDEVAQFLVTMLGSAVAFPGIGVETITLRSPAPPMGLAKSGQVFSDENLRAEGH